jgi:formylglycine-generating enzyme required for sulfatase activity
MKNSTLYTLTLLLLFSENINAQKIIRPSTPSVSKQKNKTEKGINPKIKKAPSGELAFEELDIVRVKGGTFSMGDIFEKERKLQKPPIHAETVGDFYMAKYEVSQWLWSVIMDKNPAHNYRFQCPIENVTFREIQIFILKLNEKTGRKFRLPTEAEREYAAREGGKIIKFGNGKNNATVQKMNFDSYEPNPSVFKNNLANLNSGGIAYYISDNDDVFRTTAPDPKSGTATNSANNIPSSLPSIKYPIESQPIKNFKPNSLGLYNMAGNVAEMCSDKISSNIPTVVVRGSSFYNKANECTTFYRGFMLLRSKDIGVGFRLAEDVD